MTIARSFFAEKCSRGGIAHLATERPWTLNWSRMVSSHYHILTRADVFWLRIFAKSWHFKSFNRFDVFPNAIPLALMLSTTSTSKATNATWRGPLSWAPALVPNGHRYICMDRQVGAWPWLGHGHLLAGGSKVYVRSWWDQNRSQQHGNAWKPMAAAWCLDRKQLNNCIGSDLQTLSWAIVYSHTLRPDDRNTWNTDKCGICIWMLCIVLYMLILYSLEWPVQTVTVCFDYITCGKDLHQYTRPSCNQVAMEVSCRQMSFSREGSVDGVNPRKKPWTSLDSRTGWGENLFPILVTFSPRGAILWVFWFLSWAIYF